MEEIKKVYEALAKKGLKLNPKKCFYLNKDGPITELSDLAKHVEHLTYLGMELSYDPKIVHHCIEERLYESARNYREHMKDLNIETQYTILNCLRGLAAYYLVPVVNSAEISIDQCQKLIWNTIRIALNIPHYNSDDLMRTLIPMEEPLLWTLRIALSNLVKN